MKILEQALYHLLQKKEFFAHFYLQSTVKMDAYGIPTAGAGVTKNGVEIIFNSEFLAKQNKDQAAGLIEHEIMHILLGHIYLMKDKGLNQKIANIAMDLAINQFIDALPEGAVTLSIISKEIKKNLPSGETWEYYYNELLTYAESLPDVGSIDEHGACPSDDVSHAQSKAGIKAAMDRAIKSSKGNVPESVLRIYGQLNTEIKVPWQQVLAAFVARSVSSTIINTKKKRNRRFSDLNVPGKKKKRELVLGVAADSSGSVSQEDYIQFLTEINKIAGLCNKVFFVEADCEVQSFETITRNKKPSLQRKGCGGTYYQPAIDKLMGLKCDAIIYFGDFDCADTPTNPGKPFLWVGVGKQPVPGSFGGCIRI